MEKTAIFYGSTTGVTENVAYRLAEILNIDDSHLHDVANTAPSEVEKYNLLLLGTSTWDNGDLQDDWYDFLTGLESLDLQGKVIALFGCGDQSMSNTFCNAVGTLYQRLRKSGAHFIGQIETGEYTFDHSSACVDGRFVGLLLDEVNEPEKTWNRLTHWAKLLRSEYKPEPV